jgi:hypothetical protein
MAPMVFEKKCVWGIVSFWVWIKLYQLDLISRPKDYVEILDGIMPIEK